MIITGIISIPAIGKINPMSRKKRNPKINLNKTEVARNRILIITNNKKILNKISIQSPLCDFIIMKKY